MRPHDFVHLQCVCCQDRLLQGNRCRFRDVILRTDIYRMLELNAETHIMSRPHQSREVGDHVGMWEAAHLPLIDVV
jgi:hypothetical protein